MNVLSMSEFQWFKAAENIGKWNSVIPKRAMHIQEDGDSIKFLHPTKGWRWVHKRRVGLS